MLVSYFCDTEETKFTFIIFCLVLQATVGLSNDQISTTRYSVKVKQGVGNSE